MKKKFFVLSDVHGYYSETVKAIRKSGFDPDNDSHVLVFCGDMFDRGHHNRNVLRYLDKIKNKIMIRGNHEDMLVRIIETEKLQPHHVYNGTFVTVTEFFGRNSVSYNGNVDLTWKRRKAKKLCAFIDGMSDYYETENYVFTHGWLPQDENGKILPDWRNSSPEMWQSARWTHWNEVYKISDRPDGKTVVCGHVPCQNAAGIDPARSADDCSPYFADGLIAVDAGTAASHQVNVLVLEDETL